MMATEWVDLVDEADRVIGRASRAEVRARNLLHRNVAILCLDSAGRVYVQRRSDTKDLFPGLYDPLVAGVVSSGEDYDAAAVRELREELGVVGPRPEHLFHHRYEGEATRSQTAVFRVVWNGPIRHEDGEVAWGAFCAPSEIRNNASGWVLVPDGAEIFARYERWAAASAQ